MYFVTENNIVLDSFSIDRVETTDLETILDIQIQETDQKYIGAIHFCYPLLVCVVVCFFIISEWVHFMDFCDFSTWGIK